MYGRDFLIQFKDMPVCMEKPKNLTIEIIHDPSTSGPFHMGGGMMGGGGGMGYKNDRKVRCEVWLPGAGSTVCLLVICTQGSRRGSELSKKVITHQPQMEKV